MPSFACRTRPRCRSIGECLTLTAWHTSWPQPDSPHQNPRSNFHTVNAFRIVANSCEDIIESIVSGSQNSRGYTTDRRDISNIVAFNTSRSSDPEENQQELSPSGSFDHCSSGRRALEHFSALRLDTSIACASGLSYVWQEAHR